MRYSSLIFILSGASLIAAAPTHLGERGSTKNTGWPRDHHGHAESGGLASVAKHRAAAVKEAFEFAWDGYYKYVCRCGDSEAECAHHQLTDMRSPTTNFCPSPTVSATHAMVGVLLPQMLSLQLWLWAFLKS